MNKTVMQCIKGTYRVDIFRKKKYFFGVFILLLSFICSCKSVVINPISSEEYEDSFSHELHEVKLLDRPNHALYERIALIRSAEHSIDIQTFIWKDDECGRLILYELAQAAKRGVKVRIIGDFLYIAKDPERLAVAADIKGLEIRLFNPLSTYLRPSKFNLVWGFFSRMSHVNKRMHNKLMVIDGKSSICGGRNIANEYFGESHEMNFKDLDILVKGSVCEEMSTSFESYWQSPTVKPLREFVDVKEALQEKRHKQYDINAVLCSELFDVVDQMLSDPSFIKELESGYSQVNRIAFCSDAPYKNTNKGSFYGSSHFNEMLVYSVMNAKQSIWIQSPYLIVSKRAKSVFKSIRQSNPQIDLRLSSNSLAATDNTIAYGFIYRYKRFLIDQMGVQLFEFNPLPTSLYEYFPNYNRVLKARTGKESLSPDDIKSVSPKDHPFMCIHSKSMLIDDKVSFIGSYNLDPRSANLNTEVGIIIDDPDFAKTINQYLNRDMQAGNSWPVWRRKQTFISQAIFAPLRALNRGIRSLTSLDLLPRENVVCFELKEGGTQVPPSHHDFYNNYKPRGNFPRLKGLDYKIIKSRIVKAICRFAKPLL